MEIIENWLNSDTKHYSVGRAIYKALGSSEALKQTFEMGYSDYNQNLLESELRHIISGERDFCIEPKSNMQRPGAEPSEETIEKIYNDWKPQKQVIGKTYIMDNENRFEEREEKKDIPTSTRATDIMLVERKLTQFWEKNNYSKENPFLENHSEMVFDRQPLLNEDGNDLLERKRRIAQRHTKRKDINPDHNEYMTLYSRDILRDFRELGNK